MKEKGKGLLRLHKEMQTTRELVVAGPRPPAGCMLAENVDSDGNKHYWMDMGKKLNADDKID